MSDLHSKINRFQRLFANSLILVLGFLLLSCSESIQMDWHYTEEGYALWCPVEDSVTYSWNGSTFDIVINGNGKLTKKYPSGNVTESTINAFYGAESAEDAIKVADNELYIGHVVDEHYSGFASLIKGSDVYVGNFSDGKPYGVLSMYKNSKLYYAGNWVNGKFDGEGSLYGKDGSVKTGIWEQGTLVSAEVSVTTEIGKYDGYVKDGRPNGFGTLQYKNNVTYEGEWENGIWNGIGQYTYNGDTVISEWENGVANGNTIISTENCEYEGLCKNNLPDGQGTLYSFSTDTCIYAGEWVNGVRQGYGDAVYSNGDCYYGEWQNDEYSGIGRYRYSNGDSYDGEWLHNFPNGKGHYESSHFSYDGDWLEGWIHGSGRLDYENGDIYEGDFSEGKKCGYGKYQFSNGDIYEGEFYNDQINGLGVIAFVEGNQYEGEFLNGNIYGNGTLYYHDDTGLVTLTAFWDKPNEYPSEASIVFPDGHCYEGPLINGEPTEAGVWYVLDETSDDTSKSSWIKENLTKANEFYKAHRDTWNKVVNYASFALIAVEITATIIAPFTGGATLVLASVASAANKALNAADIAVAVASAGVDLANAETREERIEAATTLGTEVVVNAALLLLPKALKSEPIKKITSKLSESAVNGARKSIVKLSKTRICGKVIQVVKDKSNKFSISFAKSKVGRTIYRITDKTKYQYVTNEQYKKMIDRHPDMKFKKFVEGSSGKNSTRLRDNMLKVMPQNAQKRYRIEGKIMNEFKEKRAQWHHVVAGGSPAAAESRNIFKKFNIDLNDPRNGILLPMNPQSLMKGTLHGKHCDSYDDYVLSRLKQAKSQKQCFEIIDEIKRDLYKGNLRLLAEHRVNTILRTKTRQSIN